MTSIRNLRQTGFTITEVLVVVSVFGITMVAMGMMFSSLQGAQRSARYLDIATNAAKDQIELLRNSNYTLLQPGTPAIDFSTSLPNELPGKTGHAVITDPLLPNLKRVDVTITYKIGNDTRTVKMTSFIGASGLAQ